MEWLKDFSAAALMAVCLIYQIRFVGNHISKVTQTLERLCEGVGRIEGKVDDCPRKH
ncbi:MAG TPA: hypothetical protein VNA25_28550 [Phycisphaerae bacterium]|nr:hypothetical protein [Phycisphaerae bacterium]